MYRFNNISTNLSYKYPLEREPHVSLLIDQGFDALVIAERVGHENVSTTLNTYAHLFPNKQTALVSSLENLGPDRDKTVANQ